MKKIALILVLFLLFPSISNAKNCRIETYSVAPTPKPNKLKSLPTSDLVTISNRNFDNAKTQLTKVYRSNPTQTEFYCGCKFSFNNKKGVVDFSKCGYKSRKNLNRASRIEWEHVMPAENFGRHLQCWRDGGRKACKKDITFNKMAGDMHNLQPAIGEVNGDRSNYRYSQFTNQFNQYGQCQSAVDFKARKFQPRDEIRGIIARTYLYMSDKYKINLSNQEEKLMTAWDKMFPPKKWECERNQLIAKIQGNDNKFITEQCNKESLN